MAKSYTYKVLYARMDEAISEEFYLEASWLAYSVLEDRLVSALDETGGAVTKAGNPIRMMGPKIDLLKETLPKNLNLRKAFFGDIFDRLEAWKEDRNDLMHAMADESRLIPDIDALAQSVALRGRDLARDYSSACRRLKKFNRG
jgi:hypothetical protein